MKAALAAELDEVFEPDGISRGGSLGIVGSWRILATFGVESASLFIVLRCNITKAEQSNSD
jgi:uncharacterized membrane protein